jgi:hypothetical protein
VEALASTRPSKVSRSGASHPKGQARACECEHSATQPERRYEYRQTIAITSSEETPAYTQHRRRSHHRSFPSHTLTSPLPYPTALKPNMQPSPEKSRSDPSASIPSHGHVSTANMRSSPLNPHSSPHNALDKSPEIASPAASSTRRNLRGKPAFAHDILDEMPDLHDHEAQAEAQDTVSSMRGEADSVGVLSGGMTYTNGNLSSASFGGSKPKADRVLGLDPHAKLASFYLVSGLPRVSHGSATNKTPVKSVALTSRTIPIGHRRIPRLHRASTHPTIRLDCSGDLIYLRQLFPDRRMTISIPRCDVIGSTPSRLI